MHTMHGATDYEAYLALPRVRRAALVRGAGRQHARRARARLHAAAGDARGPRSSGGRDRAVGRPREDAALEALRAMPSSIPPARQEALRQRARVVIAQDVRPAYARLLAFLRDDYLPHARESLAAESSPTAPPGTAPRSASTRRWTSRPSSFTPSASRRWRGSRSRRRRSWPRPVRGRLPGTFLAMRRAPTRASTRRRRRNC